jgi:anaphase-promoting complex subunit 1
MAAVTSLGLHQPAALQYAIQEQLLDENSTHPDYTWETFVNHEGDDVGEDELLVTKDAVIWSRGNIFRRCFGFKLEKEPVTQALLTYFPTSDQSSQHSPRHGSQSKLSADGRILSKALVVFLKTQAHIYFLDGTSHVVHMPFEVESACAAPQGVIIQRKQRSQGNVSTTVKFPRVPPNSFISPQTSPVSMRTSQLSTFTTDTLGRPKALPLRLNTSLDALWELPNGKDGSHWPRLVSLTDPLLDVGLVVTQPGRNAKQRTRRSSGKQPYFLDRAEEILHIEEIPNPGNDTSEPRDPLVLAVTINKETSTYSIWKFTYLKREDPFRAPAASQKKGDRRRSSMQPGLPSGVTSPLQTHFQETFGSTLPGKRSRKSERLEKQDKSLETLETTLGLDKEAGTARRTSRRVSSMLARADLSASQDRAAFGDQPQLAGHAPNRRDTSYGSARIRTSGAFQPASFSGNVMPSANALGSFLEAPVDNLLEELRAGGDFEGFHSMGLDDHDFDGLAQEVLLTKIHSVSMDNSNVRYSLSKVPARMQCRVFGLAGPVWGTDDQNRRQVLIGIQDSVERRLQLIILHLQTNKKTFKRAPETLVTFGRLWKAQNVIDSCKLTDGNISMVLVLSEAADGTRELSLQAPWSQLTSIRLPSKLCLSNIRGLDDRGGLAFREVGIRRAITPVLGELAGIRHAKLNGVVDILDSEGQQLHQIRIQLKPTRPQVAKAFEVLCATLPLPLGDNLLAGWWRTVAWLQQAQINVADVEWSAFTIQLLVVYLALGVDGTLDSFGAPPAHRRTRSLLRSSSGAQIDLGDWDGMNVFETSNAATHPSWMGNPAWQWIMEEDDSPTNMFHPSQGRQDDLSFISSHVRHAQAFMASPVGEAACGQAGYLPTAQIHPDSGRIQHAQDILVSLHLLLEEQKLDVTANHLATPRPADLRTLMLYIVKWLRWNQWAQLYELEMPVDFGGTQSSLSNSTSSLTIPEPLLWSVMDWIQSCLVEKSASRELPDASLSVPSPVLPQIKLFARLFKALRTKPDSPVGFVEAMYESGITPVVLESLPEAVLVPLQDAIAQCQARPPSTWSKDLLELVDRNDVRAVLSADMNGGHLRSSTIGVCFLFFSYHLTK